MVFLLRFEEKHLILYRIRKFRHISNTITAMRRLHEIISWTAAAALLLSVACSDSDDPTPNPPEPPAPPTPEQPKPLTESHTLIVYMLGDNNLNTDMDKNLQRVISSYYNVPENGNVVIFFDRGNYTRLTELHVEDGMVKQRVIKEFDKGTATLGAEFTGEVMAMVREAAPADSYGLILSSHGGGWVPADIFDMYYYLAPDSPSTASAPRPLFFGQDGDDYMELPELKEGLAGMDFRYIIFDACLMASVEGLYEMRSSADRIIASSAEILGTGFPYEDVVPMLFYEGHRLEEVCKEYMDFYRSSSGTISLVDCSGMEALAAAMKDVLAAGGDADVTKVQAYDGFYRHLYFDLEQYVEQLTSDETLRGNFREALAKAVPFTDHTPSFYTGFVYSGGGGQDAHTIDLPRSCGLTCHIEQEDCPKTHEAWLETAWAKAVGGK